MDDTAKRYYASLGSYGENDLALYQGMALAMPQSTTTYGALAPGAFFFAKQVKQQGELLAHDQGLKPHLFPSLPRHG
jgi:hypothetical protein